MGLLSVLMILGPIWFMRRRERTAAAADGAAPTPGRTGIFGEMPDTAVIAGPYGFGIGAGRRQSFWD